METLMGVGMGIGLAAACGFRVFVPLLVLAVASRAGLAHLSDHTQWLGSTPALVALTVACLVEVVAYWMPSVDHALDVIAAPTALVAGTLAAASQFGDFGPVLSWGFAAIAGGSAAGASTALNIFTRGIGTITTGGVFNPIISAAQGITGTALSILSILVPLVALVLVAMLIAVAIWWYLARSKRATLVPAAA
ncbi:MAG: DUF4126 domain-containing protein [Planctomycetota bacterium]|nr:DUF4126 domain-containing protein [Planctomycetota bacterium]